MDLVLQVAEVVVEVEVVVAEGEEVEPNQVTQLPEESRQIMELLADKENSINFRTRQTMETLLNAHSAFFVHSVYFLES